MTGRPYAAIYRGRGTGRFRGAVLLDVDLGFYRWRLETPCRPARRVVTARYLAALAPGQRVTATITPAGPGDYVADLAPPGVADYRYPATVLHTTDGDTVVADIELGLDEMWRDRPVRLSGVNLRELKDPGGREARNNTDAEITAASPARRVVLHTAKPDKYGDRIDARIELADGRDLAAALIAGGWALPWNGRGPKPVPAWPIGTPA